MNTIPPIIAHGDLGIPAYVIELMMLILVLWVIGGILVFVNLALILSLESSSASKKSHLLWWGLNVVSWAILIFGLANGIPPSVFFRVVCALAVPISVLYHFCVLFSLFRNQNRTTNTHQSESDIP